jgi:MFS-type transporter involved in bile tolerance (Atg22 family)
MPRVSNITDRGRRRRLTGGIIWLGIASLATAVLAFSRASGWWYALLVLPFSAAALGYFQARERT